MKHDLCRTDRSRVRAVFVLVGAAAIAVSATPQSAAAQTERWTAREFQARVFGVDDAVDIAYWKDGNDEWIYMTGYQTTASGATVFATHKYDANFSGPGENEPIVSRFYPDPPAGATGTNRAVAIEVDSDGNVYVTGESTDPTGANGLDYVTIKYDKDLVPDEDWEAAGHADAVVRWDNPTFAGPGSHDSPVDIALGKQFIGTPSDNIIGITGRSYGGLPTRNDIVTVLMEAGTGNLFAGWPSVGGLGLGARSFNGSANGHDWPVGLDLEWQPIPEGPGDVYTVVAGTTRSSGPANNDIVTMAYDPAGNLAWTNVYNGPMDGDDVATAMDVD